MTFIKRPDVCVMRRLLTDARGYIEDHTTRYLCVAIRWAIINTEDYPTAAYLKKYIGEALEGSSSLEIWMRSQGRLDELRRFGVYEARLAWIDWLLEGLGD